MTENTPTSQKMRTRTATQFFLKGLAISLPTILTLVILIWIGRGINDYIISPISAVVRYAVAQLIDESVPTQTLTTMDGLPSLPYCEEDYRITENERDRLERFLKISNRSRMAPSELGGAATAANTQPVSPEGTEEAAARDLPQAVVPAVTTLTLREVDLEQVYVPVGDRQWSVPYNDYVMVATKLKPANMPTTVVGLYMEVVPSRLPKGLFGLSALAVAISIIILYYLGRIGTARVGAWGVQKFETVFLGKLPVVSNVYSSVKQVTDFLFTQQTDSYTRVVAVEYPRRGIWSLGFVTGESLLEMTAAAGEPLVSVLVPTSPMPVTGYTINVPRSEVLDMNITIDQAFQFCLSCGVHIPPQQRVTAELLQQELAKRLTGVSDRRIIPTKATHVARPPLGDSELPEPSEPSPNGAENPNNEESEQDSL